MIYGSKMIKENYVNSEIKFVKNPVIHLITKVLQSRTRRPLKLFEITDFQGALQQENPCTAF